METATKNPYAVKNVKSFQAREGMGFECSLYKDGKRIGTVTDVCNGGGVLQMYLNDGEEDALYEYCKTLPQIEAKIPKEPAPRDGEYTGEYEEFSYDNDPCIFVGGLVDKFEADARLKKQCKTKTLVEVEENGKTETYVYKCKFSLAIKKQIKDRDYPDTDIVFVNERYLHEKYL